MSSTSVRVASFAAGATAVLVAWPCGPRAVFHRSPGPDVVAYASPPRPFLMIAGVTALVFAAIG